MNKLFNNFNKNKGKNSNGNLNSNVKLNTSTSKLPTFSRSSNGPFSKLSDEVYYGIMALLSIAILLVISYVIAFSIKYARTKCERKKPYFKYLFGFCWNNVCDSDNPKEVNNTYYMKPPPVIPSSVIPNDPGHNNTDVVKSDLSKLEGSPQVFNISNQDYTYEQAKCKCSSYNAKLASYDQVVEAYNKGADWCSYGWSEGQNAFYPTQKCTWDKLQQEESTANDCGKQGVNGGFFADPYLKFGANCYGKKPEGKIVKMKKPQCKTQNAFCSLKANNSASTRLDTDEISPFNENTWYEIK